MEPNPWTLYWQADNLDSCIASQYPEDIDSIKAFWRLLSERISADAKVLDLASGNGAVPSILLQASKALKVTAVDLADIEPSNYVSQAPELKKVSFHPGIDICDLPFPASSFDAVTSQFGIEYAALQHAVPSATRVLRTGGQLQLLMHHISSDVVEPAGKKRQEIDQLLAPGGVVECACAYTAGAVTSEQLEEIGQQYLQSAEHKTQAISGQIFAGVNQIMELQATNPAAAGALAQTMQLRLRAENSRLQQLQAAAQSSAQIEQLCASLRDADIQINLCEELIINSRDRGDALLGWQLIGTKK